MPVAKEETRISPAQQVRDRWKQKANRKLTEGGFDLADMSHTAKVIHEKIKAKTPQQISDIRDQAGAYFNLLNSETLSADLSKQYKIFDQACQSLSVKRESFYSKSLKEGNVKVIDALSRLNDILNLLKAGNANAAKSQLEQFYIKDLQINMADEIKNKQDMIKGNIKKKENLDAKLEEVLKKLVHFAEEHLEQKSDVKRFKKNLENSKQALKEMLNIDAKIALKLPAKTETSGSNVTKSTEAEGHDPHQNVSFWEQPAYIATFFELIAQENLSAYITSQTKSIMLEMNNSIAEKNANKKKEEPMLKPINQAEAYRLLLKRSGLKPALEKLELLKNTSRLLEGTSLNARSELSQAVPSMSESMIMQSTESRASQTADPETTRLLSEIARVKSELALVNERISKLKSLSSLSLDLSKTFETNGPSLSRHAISFFEPVSANVASSTVTSNNSQSSASTSNSYRAPVEKIMHPLVLELVKKLRYECYSHVARMKTNDGKSLTRTLIEVNAMIKDITANGDNLTNSKTAIQNAKSKAEKIHPTLCKTLTDYGNKIEAELQPQKRSFISRLLSR